MRLSSKERVKKVLLRIRKIFGWALFFVVLSFPFTLNAETKSSKAISKEVKRFFNAYQLMAKHANDTVKTRNILDTLQVPEYMKEVFEFMAFYPRVIFTGRHLVCVDKAKKLLDKIEREYSGTIPEHHYKWMIGAINHGYGSCLYYLGDYINSFFAYKKAYEMFNSIGDSTFAAIALTNMATVLVRVKMYDEVLKYYVLAKKYLIRDSFRLIPLNMNIGVIYKFLKRPDLALRYYNEALTLAEYILERDSAKLTEVEKRRILFRKNSIKINIASLFLDVAKNSSLQHNMDFIKKMKISVVKLLDSARALNRQVDTQAINLMFKGAYLDNELNYWQVRYTLEKTQQAKDSLVKYLLTIRRFYENQGVYDKEGRKSAFLAVLENRNLLDLDKRELYRECLEMIELEHEELQSLAASLVNIDLPTTSEGDFEKLLGELPYQCNLKYTVSVGLAILFGTILVLVAFLYSRGRREART